MNEETENKRCTYHRPYGEVCGRSRENKSVHVWEERMRPGAHVWRHDRKDAYRLHEALR